MNPRTSMSRIANLRVEPPRRWSTVAASSCSVVSAVLAALVALGILGGCDGGEPGEKGAEPPPPASPAQDRRLHTPEGLEAAPEDGQGRVRISPAGPVTVGARGTWEVTWTAGSAGLAPGGGVVLQVSPFWGWSEPQSQAPNRPGFTTVHSSQSELEWEVGAVGVPHAFQARLLEGALAAGEEVTFVYGDTTVAGASARAQADVYAEAFEELLIKTDGNGDGFFAAPLDQPTLTIRPGAAAGLAVAAPAAISTGEPVRVVVTALDPGANRTSLPSGEVRLYLAPLRRHANEKPPERSLWATGSAAAGGDRVELAVTEPRPAGLYRLEAELGALRGRNDLLFVRDDAQFSNVLWGDIHTHSALSDGTGAPAALYAYARDVSGLDVCAVTDHDAHGLFPLSERGGWERVRRATEAAYEPGRFVTLLGYEWTSWKYGHRNVYYPEDEGEVFAFLDPRADSPQKLWDEITAFGGQTIAHHSGGGPVPTDWSVSTDGRPETVVEICSIHGSSEAIGVERGIYRPVPGASVRDALRAGHRLGILAATDTHDGHPGRRTRGAPAHGLAAFRTGERTREAVFAAMRDRRVYGTSGPRILLESRWGDEWPGRELARMPDRPLTVSVVAPEPIETIELIGPDGVVAREYGGSRVLEVSFQLDAAPAWVYVRVALADGEVAWDSPWWIGES